METEDWDLSAEELDSLERDAFRQIALRNSSSSTASVSNNSIHSSNPNPNPIIPSLPRKVDDLPPGSRIPPPSTVVSNCSKELHKLSVKFFLHASGNIAAKFSYDPVVVGAFRKISKASWNAKERLWMFPLSSLSSAEKVLHEITGINVEIENIDPLVRRAIDAATAVPDLRDRYDRIPSYIETKLLPFQRDGIRFILQHGGRVLLADEMGLGKTLQAIAVTTCVRDSWPVLVLTPSSLRLHWASMIQQWLNIPSSDILVVLSQWSGSNRGGFRIVPSNTKGTIHLDGVFNIISYDVVLKLQKILAESEFKVVIADESHFLKNAQAKRTSASLPVLQEPNIGYDEELFAACMRRFLYIRCYDSFEFLATLKTLRYRLQRARETHGVTAHFLMIDSIGAFYWVDRASTSLHLESNSRKRLSLQSVSETVVEEIRKLLLVHPMLVLATKATILGDTYTTNEVKRTSMKLSSNDPSNLRIVTGGPQKLSYREFMPLVWQSFVTHRILVRAADDDPANSKYQSRSIFLSEWLMPSLNFSDKFIVRDAGVFVVS